MTKSDELSCVRAGAVSRGGVRTQVSGLVVETQQLSQYQEAIPAMGSSLIMVMLLDVDDVRQSDVWCHVGNEEYNTLGGRPAPSIFSFEFSLQGVYSLQSPFKTSSHITYMSECSSHRGILARAIFGDWSRKCRRCRSRL